MDYASGWFIERYRSKKSLAIGGMINSVLVNLFLLGTFKYADFITKNVNLILGTSFAEPGILLPVGISFYTFQTMSYTIDVYKGEIKAEKSFVNFLMYVSMFPQLVAGPIVRYSEIAQAINNRVFSWDMVGSGANRFCFGLFKKVVLANSVGGLVEKYLDNQFYNLSTAEAWYGISLFSLQLYFDFSGYSDMAIGLGRIFGFKYPENFRHPYAAISVADFYKRWHMTLGRFFRDYVYIPLGGNRKYQIRNILVVWFLTGLWHGPSWNFVMWGLFLGCFMVIERLLKKYLDMLPLILRYMYTLILINYSRAFFYFDDFEKLRSFLITLIISDKPVGVGLISDLASYSFLYAVVILFCIPWDEIYERNTRVYKQLDMIYNKFAFFINVIFMLISTILIIDDTYNPFIYFRF
jgi:alginate O-acetyltransferase complex protein AlgI